MKKINVAVVGATGLVGSMMLKVLSEENFPIDNLFLFSSKKSAGKIINYCGKDYTVEELKEDSFDGRDIKMSKNKNTTRARGYQSYHQFGLAADVAFKRNGKVVISERDPWAMRGYELYGEVAESVGLTWGGRWKSIKDYGHTEYRIPDARLKENPGNGRKADLGRSADGQCTRLKIIPGLCR